MVFAALRGLMINGLQSPALERHVNLALSMTVGSLGPSACLLIWSFYKEVVVVVQLRTCLLPTVWG
jgi:flagellar biosynthesis protein FliP